MSARTSAFSTIGTQLMYKQSTSYSKLVDIKDFPNLGGEPEKIQTTTLSNGQHTYTEGVQDTDNLTFTANYTKSVYETIVALKGTEQTFAVYFGSSGDDGKFYFKGTISVFVKGAGVNDVVEMQITIVPTTEITTTEPS